MSSGNKFATTNLCPVKNTEYYGALIKTKTKIHLYEIKYDILKNNIYGKRGLFEISVFYTGLLIKILSAEWQGSKRLTLATNHAQTSSQEFLS